MTDFVVSLVFIVGAAVCLAGGVAISAIVITWALDKVLVATGNMGIVSQWWLAKKFPNRFKG